MDRATTARRRSLALAALVGLGLSLGPQLAPATIEEQRARLPPPAQHCGDDPLTGTWQAHTYYAHVQQWYRFELEVRRDPEDPAGERLKGSIHAEFWNGGPERSEPPRCSDPGRRRAVFENATGRGEGFELRFEAVDWRDAQLCGPLGGGYLLDRFSGTVEPERWEFQSVLNADAPQWRDVPTVFRRIRCGPKDPRQADEPRIVVAPPPYEPPEREGCGLR